MPYNALDGLMAPDLGAQWQNAIMSGMEFARQTKARSALAAYATNPNPQTAAAIVAHDPMMGLKVGEYEREREKERRKAEQQAQAMDLQRRAAAGDKAAKAQLAGIDFDAWNALDDNQRAEVEKQTNYIGQAALKVAQMPENQRAMAWDSAIEEGVRLGYQGLAQYRGGYTPQALDSVLNNAGLMDDFIKTTAPDWKPLGPGERFVDTNNPRAMAQFGGAGGGALPTVTDQATYDAVPPGGQYRDPQGNIRTKPGGGVGNGTGGFR